MNAVSECFTWSYSCKDNLLRARMTFAFLAVFFHLSGVINICVAIISESEYATLLDFYQSTNGNQWNDKTGWQFVNYTNCSRGMNEICIDYIPTMLNCSITLTGTTTNNNNSNNNTNNDDYSITTFETMGNNLNGTLPASLVNLTQMSLFSIQTEPLLTGYIPSSVYNWTKLQHLFVAETVSLHFQITSDICNLNELELIEFTTIGSITGIIPDCIGNFTKLYQLWLDIPCVITGSLPASLFTLPQLAILRIVQSPNNSNSNINSNHNHNYDLSPVSAGHLPSVIDLPKLTYFYLDHTYLGGTIPQSICNIGYNASKDTSTFDKQFYIGYADLGGTIPTCLFEHAIIQGISTFKLDTNRLTGSISNDVNLTKFYQNSNNSCSFQIFCLSNNELNGTIPDWMIGCEYTFLELSNNNLYGTLKSGWNVQLIGEFSNNQFTGTIPIDLFNLTSSITIEDIELNNNKLTGDIPPFFTQFTNLCQLLLQSNLFTSFPFNQTSLPNFQQLILFSNKIEIDDIGGTLSMFFKNNPMITQIMLHENEKISGKLDKWQYNNYTSNNLEILTLHKCNIGGKIPNGLKLNQTTIVTLYDNRLSCQVPNDFILDGSGNTNGNGNAKKLKHVLILLGNLFTYNTGIKWLENSSSFSDALNLYLTTSQIYPLYVYISVAGIGVIVAMLLYLFHIRKLRAQYTMDMIERKSILWQAYNYDNETVEDVHVDNKSRNKMQHIGSAHEEDIDTNIFLFHFDNAMGITFSWYHLIIAVILCFFYYIGADYYECGRITGHLSMIYFDSKNELKQLLVAVFIILLNAFILLKLFYFEKESNQLNAAMGNINNNNGSNLRMSLHSTYDELANYNYNNENHNRCKPSVIIWILLYLLTILFTLAYIVLHTLPQHNILHINVQSTYDYVIYYLLSISLALSNIYVVPRMVDTCYCLGCSTNRGIIIAIFRSFTSFIFPFIFSIIFLNDCGHYWSNLWQECENNSQYENSFNWRTNYTVSSGVDYVPLSVSTHRGVCHKKSWTSIDSNQCYRSFLDLWIPLIAAKLLVVIINPWVILWFKIKFNHLYPNTKRQRKSTTIATKQNEKKQIGAIGASDDRRSLIKTQVAAAVATTEHENINRAKRNSNPINYNYSFNSKESVGGANYKFTTGTNVSMTSNVEERQTVFIDAQYGLLATKIELCVIFGMFAPFLFGIAALSAMSNFYAYLTLVNKFKHVRIYDAFNVFPAVFVFCSVIVAQCLMVMFCWSFFHWLILGVMIAVFALLDIIYAYLWCTRVKN